MDIFYGLNILSVLSVYALMVFKIFKKLYTTIYKYKFFASFNLFTY